ncbi:MAG: biopolymer transport protein ExbB [Candidatus Promineifilaceae bacterium]|jgi:biopolymer transport protein ExbB
MILKRRRAGLLLASCSTFMMAASSVVAQTVEGATASPVGLTWREILRSGGVPLYSIAGLLCVMSVLTVALVIYFTIVLRPSQVAPLALERSIIDSIRQGSLDSARKACEHQPSPLSAVTLSAMDYMRDVPHVDASLMKDIMEGEGARQSESIQGQTQYLLDVAVVSPMVGLLGTVMGMMRAFSAIATDIASAKPIVLAEGVSQALLTTAWGLTLGIPAMIAYAFFRRRSSMVVSHLESASTDVLIALQIRREG